MEKFSYAYENKVDKIFNYLLMRSRVEKIIDDLFKINYYNLAKGGEKAEKKVGKTILSHMTL